jgi:hypothetical protein
MNKCPRCNLPQNGIYKCQFCGYDLKKYNKRPTTIIRKRFKDFIGGFKHSQIKKGNAYSNNNLGKALKKTNGNVARSRTDRRKLRYTAYFPERRSGLERRK